MVKRTIVWVLLSVLLFSACEDGLIPDAVQMNLNGRWEFRAAHEQEWHEATVPGTVHTDLYKNVLIEDPFDRDNEFKLQWIDTLDWVYIKEFLPDQLLLAQDSIKLIFEGLDTFTEVFFNDHKVLETDNMFRRYAVNVTRLMNKSAPNQIKVRIQSPTKTLKKIYDQQDFHLPAANDRAEEKLSVYVRKAPYHFGWDWGPRFVTSGIWKSVYLQAWTSMHIEDVFYHQTSLSDQKATLSAEITVNSTKKQAAELIIHDETSDQIIASEPIALVKGINKLTQEICINNPERWWPNGLGNPHLYHLKAEIKNRKSNSELHSKIGLRTVELIRAADSIGESFYFKVNDIPVFMKGANYIPQDNFVNHVMSTEYDHLIRSVKDANMNMLRVWGGGIYEHDYFYQLCDENGILVWQDFMFACSMYPGNPEFLDNIREEAKQNIIRLRNHPSVALWCGNNEVQDAWFGWGWQFRYNDKEKSIINSNYQTLFHEVLPAMVHEYDPTRAYWPSSPASGEDFGQRSDTSSGDFHYWGVWHGRQPFESYGTMIPRFSSEYGFQSFPDIKTVESYTLPADRHIESTVMQAHQKHPIGNQLILNYMERYYPVPDDFNGFIYMSQVMQGEGVRYGIEMLRQNMPRCMGSLYWQLNDCWPVASWSGIDYFGRWKALHYQAKRAYAPIILSFYEDDEKVYLYVISDNPGPVSGEIRIKLMNFSGKKLFSHRFETTAHPFKADIQWVYKKSQWPGNLDDMILTSSLITDHDSIGNHHYFCRAKDLSLPPADIRIETTDHANTITLTSAQLVKQLYLNYTGEDEVRFEPNYFDLLPGRKQDVIIHKRSKDNFNLEGLEFYSVNAYQKN